MFVQPFGGILLYNPPLCWLKILPEVSSGGSSDSPCRIKGDDKTFIPGFRQQLFPEIIDFKLGW